MLQAADDPDDLDPTHELASATSGTTISRFAQVGYGAEREDEEEGGEGGVRRSLSDPEEDGSGPEKAEDTPSVGAPSEDDFFDSLGTPTLSQSGEEATEKPVE